MAGRGTDISLGGNAEYLAKAEMRRMQISEEVISEASGFADTDDAHILEARELFNNLLAKYKAEIKHPKEEVLELGGLVIIGTERHETRRIDNQLRGRSGRQGDPGETRFYLSLEDDLMRLFGGDRLKVWMDKLNVAEDEPIDSRMVTNAIESAQRKVEGRDFGIRKNVLQFDDVMDRQRQIIYDQRNKVLDGDDIRAQIIKMIEQSIEKNVSRYLPTSKHDETWNFVGLKDFYLGWLITEDDLNYSDEEIKNLKAEDIIKTLTEKALSMYEEREKTFGEDMTREIERVVLLKNVDTYWMNHIDAMEELKRGIRLRAYAQRDPVVEYRIEGFDMFDEMIDNIRDDTVKILLTFTLPSNNKAPERHDNDAPQVAPSSDGYAPEIKTVRNTEKIGRNDPCPCGSGKKYKKCCGANK